MTDKPGGHVATNIIRDGILDYQVDYCPKCSSMVEDGYGLAGGGIGAYGYCPKCERIVWKCLEAE